MKNVPESNGRVGILGISYNGFLPLDGARESAPGAQGIGADESHGRWLDRRRLVSQRRLPPTDDGLHLQPGGDAQVGGQVVGQPPRRLRHVHAGGFGGGARPSTRARAGRLLAQAPRASKLRRVLARPGGGQDPRRPAAEGAGDAGPQPLGPGRHLRRHRRLPGDRAEGHGQRQGLPGDGPLVPRPDRSGTAARWAPCDSTATPASTSAGRSCGRSSISYLKDDAPQSRRGAGDGVRDGDERVAAAARLAFWLR